jgi:hypothetical protein
LREWKSVCVFSALYSKFLAKIPYIDDDEDLWVPERLVEQVQDIGEIIVAFYRKQRIQQNRIFGRRNGSSVRRLSNLENLDVIPEKALKGRAVSHRARYV